MNRELAALMDLFDCAMTHMADPLDKPEVRKASSIIDEYRNQQNGREPFDEFWQIYPRRVGKPSARRAFNRLSKKDQRALMDHLPKRKWPGDKQYIPHPGTFIHQRRWEDEDQATTVTAQDDIF